MKHPFIPFAALAVLFSTSTIAAPKPPVGLDKIGHILVIYLENHSFDNLYGQFPGADGIAQAKPEQILQVDSQGKVFEHLPPVPDDPRFPQDLANAPFPIDDYVPPEDKIHDPVHAFFLHQRQIDGGRMNRFADLSNVKGLVMGYYRGGTLPLWDYAKRYTLADHFFQAAFGGSFLNHQWLVCACTPQFEAAGPKLRAVYDDHGKLIKEGPVLPDGSVVSSLFPVQGPYPADTKPEKLLPVQTAPNIGDRLTEKGVDWAWYAGGWKDAIAGHPDASFQFHHQPFAYFQGYGPDSKGRSEHLKDEQDLQKDIDQGRLPPVAFYKPIGALNEHPGYADLMSGEKHIAELLQKLEKSPLWKDMVVIVTYDENGGFWDHVPPPKGDQFGPGSRVPALIISPFARKGFVDHTVYDTTSLLKLIEQRHRLAPLTKRDGNAVGLENALQF